MASDRLGEQFGPRFDRTALVRDTEAAYHFAHRYPVDSLFPIQITSGETSISIMQLSEGDGPWQYRYVKSCELTGTDGLAIHYELTNTGSAAWRFEHYNHH